MIMQQQPQPSQNQLHENQPSSEELCNLLVQGLIAKDEKLLYKVLEQEDEAIIKDIIIRVPVNHVRKLIIELTNILSTDLTPNHLRWLQQILPLKYSVVASMSDGRSILLPLISLLNDKSSPSYYNKMQDLRGKLTLLNSLKESRKIEHAESIVKVREERDEPAQMEIESDTDTESEEEFESKSSSDTPDAEMFEEDVVDDDDDDDDEQDEEQEQGD